MIALLHLLAEVQDTNVIGRAGQDVMKDIQHGLRQFLDTDPDTAAILKHADTLDVSFIETNISPGGCADLLAITYMMHFLSVLFEEQIP